MQVWEKKYLLDCFGKTIFTRQLGYGVMPLFDASTFTLISKDNVSLKLKDLFIKKDDSYVRVDFKSEELLKGLSSQSFYICSSFINKEFKPVEIMRVVYEQSVRVLSSFSDLSLKQSEWKKKVLFLDLATKEFLEHKIYAIDAKPIFAIRNLSFRDFLFGDELFYIGKGVCEVTKTYLSDDVQNYLCKVSFDGESEETILFGDSNFVTTPDKYNAFIKKVSSILKQKKNEDLYQCVVLENKNSSNSVFFKPIDGAEKYVVSIFKIMQNKIETTLYHLKDIDLVKTTHCFFLSDEEYAKLGPSIFIQISAFDSNNNEIAVTGDIYL